MDKFDLEDIKNITKEKIAISKFQKDNYMNKENTYITNFKKRIIFVEKTVVTLALCFVFLTGIAFSTNISNYIYNFYQTGKGVEIAIANGYNAKFNEEYTISSQEIIDLNDNNKSISQDAIKVTVDDVVMDDSSLSIEFNISLSDEIYNNINEEGNILQNFPDLQINLKDLLISDENNNILFSSSLSQANEFLGFEEKIDSLTGNPDYNKLFESGKYFDGGLNNFVLENENGKLKLIYNMNITGKEYFYPRSKKLNFEFSQIDIINNNVSTTSGIFNYKGEWRFSLDLPENVTNRKRIIYKQINETSEDKILSCNVLSTGTQINLSLKTDSSIDTTESPQLKLINTMEIEKPTVQIRDWFVDKLMASEEYKKYEEDLNKIYTIDEAYIENENGERFEISVGPFANGGGNISNNFYTPTLIFDLTTNNITNKLKIYLKYSDREYVFELEKEAEV